VLYKSELIRLLEDWRRQAKSWGSKFEEYKDQT